MKDWGSGVWGRREGARIPHAGCGSIFWKLSRDTAGPNAGPAYPWLPNLASLTGCLFCAGCGVDSRRIQWLRIRLKPGALKCAWKPLRGAFLLARLKPCP